MTAGAPDQDRLDRERRAHDELAADLDPAGMPPEPISNLDRAALSPAGELRGKRVLDLGCGSGDLSLALIAQGARVTAVDLSPGMVEVARRRAERFCEDPSLGDFRAAAVESLDLESDSHDIAFGRFVLHHLDLSLAAPQIARVLKPGGTAIFVENSGRNRLLMWARDNVAGRFGVARFGTVDERPLGPGDVELLRASFASIEFEYPEFDFFTIFDRQVFRGRWQILSAFFRGLDRTIWRLAPFLRSYSFRVVVRGTA